MAHNDLCPTLTYVDAATLDAAVAEAGVETWIDLFNQKGGNPAGKPNTLWLNAELPTVNPWMVVDSLGPMPHR